LRRARRPLPLIFWITFALIASGSVLHEPNNFDGLMYRIPKVLCWLNQHHWHWVQTMDEEVNYTLPNYEWLTMPLYLLSGGFHLTVVINWLCFLLIPSLFFTLLRAFGVSGRLAHDWMWLFQSGYVIAMQAGGIGNDLCGLTALLAALHCANRCRTRFRPGLAADALVAAAFCTGVKMSNVPLAGFVLILLAGSGAQLRSRLLPLSVIAGLAMLVSAAIPMALNFTHAGTILGASPAWDFDEVKNPAAGLAGNTLILAASTLQPPRVAGRDGHHLGHGEGPRAAVGRLVKGALFQVRPAVDRACAGGIGRARIGSDNRVRVVPPAVVARRPPPFGPGGKCGSCRLAEAGMVDLACDFVCGHRLETGRGRTAGVAGVRRAGERQRDTGGPPDSVAAPGAAARAHQAGARLPAEAVRA
jgi:hypothetical protein